MPERRQRKPEKRPDEILDAATKVFSRRGYDGARMDDIARQAGLSKGALYLYFASKSMLLDAIVTRFADRFTTAISQDMLEQARQDPLKAISILVQRAIALASDPNITLVPRLVMAEATRDANIAALYRRRILDVLEHSVSDLLEEGVRQGVFRRVRAASLIRLMLGPVMAHMMLGHVFVVEGQAALAPQVFEEDLLAVLLDGLKAEEGA